MKTLPWTETAPAEQPPESAGPHRHSVDDLISLFSLPATWGGTGPAQIAQALVDALVRMLDLDLIYVRLNPTKDEEAIALVKTGPKPAPMSHPHEASAVLGRALGDDPSTWPPRTRRRVAGIDHSIVTVHLGAQGEIGVLVVASTRADFGESSELLLLNVAANQAVIALQGARLRGAQARVEVALRESESSSCSVIDGIPGFVAILAANGSLEAANRKVIEYTGLSLEGLQQWGTNGTVHPDDLPHFSEIFMKSIAAGSAYETEQRLRRHDGAYRWFDSRGTPVRDASGCVVRWYVLLADIDEKRRAEEALRARELVSREIVDNIPHIISLMSPTGDIELINRQILDYTGQSAADLTKWVTGNVVHPDDLAHVRESHANGISASEPYAIVYRLRRFDGVYRWFESHHRPIKDFEGHVVRWCLSITDIDDRKRAEDALRESERQCRLIVDTIPTLAWSAQTDSIADFFNQHYQDFVGLSADQLQGWGWTSALHPDDVATLASAWLSMMDSGRGSETEARLRRFDGEYRWVMMRTNPLRDEQGNIIRWYGTNTDIEDRKRAEAQLAGEKRLLEMIASGSELRDVFNAICAFFEDATVDCNCGIYPIDWGGPIFQYGVAPSLPASYTDPIAGMCVSYDLAPCGIAAFDKIQVIAEDMDSDPRWLTSSYRTHVLEHGLRAVWSTPICSLEGGVLGTFCIYQRHPGTPSTHHQGLISHVTHIASIAIERSRAEAALRRSEAFLAEGQRISLTGSFAWRLDTDEITFSDELYRIFELEKQLPVTLEQIGARVHPEDLPLLAEKIEIARAGVTDHNYDIRLVRPGGQIRHLRTVARAVSHQGGRLEYLGTIQDITDRRLAEDALANVRSELAHVTRTMSLGVLTASIAHEVNQPLSGIITNANTCQRMLAATPPNIEGALETVRRTIRDGHRASEVIARLRALFGKKAVVTEAVDLNRATREVIALSCQDLQRRRICLQTELDYGLPPVRGDCVQLQQVILNLLLNACDAMKTVNDRPKQIAIRTTCDADGGARLTVRDSGIGVVAESLNKLFDAFYTTKADGMGIGLSVSRSIIESHQGRLWCEPHDGPGATFAFSIPLMQRGAIDDNRNL